MASSTVENASPPSQRTSTTEPPNNPLTLFDSHLHFLSDSYIAFFQERKRVEESYVEALSRLHRKCKIIDQQLDERTESSTTRNAWGEVRDNIEREAETRMAFINTLTTDVLSPLLTFKETQDRIRKRIREDLKDAVVAHNDYIENIYPKLKRSYLKKSQEVEDIKTAATQIPPVSPTHSSDGPQTLPKPSVSPPSRPIVTAPQPLRPLERRASGSIPTTRNRSPSASSSALQDLAHHGKKRMDQLMTFLDKNNVKDTILAGRSEGPLRSVKAKREAEEADKEYRKSVHWLETLRIRRVKLLESGYNSVESFVRESSETVKHVLDRYINNLSATAITQSQLCGHAQRAVEKISPERDIGIVSARIPRLLALATPKPVYYYNYSVGECRDLIFGVSLVDYATSRGLADGDIPKIVKLCIKEIEERGLNSEGIYRVSGRHAAVLELQHKVERNEAAFSFTPPHDDVYAITSLLKLYLRELPEPVFRFPLQERVQHSEDIEEHFSNNFQVLRSKIRRLPPPHQATLKALLEHLSRVATRTDKNKMDAHNLAISFSTVLFGEDELPKGNDLLSVQPWKDSVMEDLIVHATTLFQSTYSPPLPPAPLGEAPPAVTYGSSHTRVAKVIPPRSPSPRFRDPYAIRPTQSEGRSRKGASEEFAPQPPPQPINSIHPSLRSGPMSGSSGRQVIPPPARAAQYFEEHIPYAQYTGPSQPSNAHLPAGAAPPSSGKSDQSFHPSSPLVSPWTDRPVSPPLATLSLSQQSTASSSTFESISDPPTDERKDERKPLESNGSISSRKNLRVATPALPSSMAEFGVQDRTIQPLSITKTTPLPATPTDDEEPELPGGLPRSSPVGQ